MSTAKTLLGWIGGLLAAAAVLAASVPKSPTTLCVDGKCNAQSAQPGTKAKSASSFVDSIGINVHMTLTDTAYVRSFQNVKEKLLALGILHLRDGAQDNQGTFFSGDQAGLFRELGAAGLRCTFIFNANVAKAFVQGFPARVAPAFEAYEYPNELNTAAHPDWIETLRAWAPTFQSYVRSNSATADYPIIGPSLIDLGDHPHSQLGSLEESMNFGNTHAYYTSRNPATPGWGGPGLAPCEASRYGSIAYTLCNARQVSGQKPIMITEAGWGTDVKVQGQVPESVQAKYLARMLLLHFDAGVVRTFIYQLVDSGGDGFYAYGLITAEGREKSAFKELKSLIAMMRDASTVDEPGSLAFSLSGNASDVHTMLFQKSDGSFRLLAWIEKPGFDPLNGATITVSPQKVTLHLQPATAAREIATFQDDGSFRMDSAPRSGSGEYALTITDNLTVVSIFP